MYEKVLQILPDDPGDDAHGDTVLGIQLGDHKANIILLASHTVVIAGVSYRVGPVGKPYIDDTAVYIGDTAGITALYTAFLQIFGAGVGSGALNIRTDRQRFGGIAAHLLYAYKNLIADRKRS